MGALYPIGGLLAFIIPIFICTTPEPFEHDIEEELAEESKAVEGGNTAINEKAEAVEELVPAAGAASEEPKAE